MNGFSIASNTQLYQISDQNWQIAGTGDFDGDGKCDIPWRNSKYLPDGHLVHEWTLVQYGQPAADGLLRRQRF